jgi:Acetyltransferases
MITSGFWVNSFDGNYISNRFKVAIIEQNNKDVGAGGFGLSRDYDDWGEVTSIYLLPNAWGSGAAKMLMDFMVLQLQNQGFKNINLWVLSNNQRALRFYAKYGFVFTGNRRDISFGGETKTEDEFSLFIP